MPGQYLPVLRELVLCPKRTRLTGNKLPGKTGVEWAPTVCTAPAQPSRCTHCCLPCGERNAPSITRRVRAPGGRAQAPHREQVPGPLAARLSSSLMTAGSPSNGGVGEAGEGLLTSLRRCSLETALSKEGTSTGSFPFPRHTLSLF